MESSNQHIVNNRISAYLTQKVKEAFPEDFWLIENQLPSMTARYSLKELLLLVRIQLEQIKRTKTSKNT